mmetsp:Transcript_153777/g.283388  ORF Transcript_153777/g.283388 Transcript_153777/m.283388 type:complete len:216 (-) Transcript_153777:98-745(-)
MKLRCFSRQSTMARVMRHVLPLPGRPTTRKAVGPQCGSLLSYLSMAAKIFCHPAFLSGAFRSPSPMSSCTPALLTILMTRFCLVPTLGGGCAVSFACGGGGRFGLVTVMVGTAHSFTSRRMPERASMRKLWRAFTFDLTLVSSSSKASAGTSHKALFMLSKCFRITGPAFGALIGSLKRHSSLGAGSSSLLSCRENRQPFDPRGVSRTVPSRKLI